ncbi:MAG: replication initiation protein [Desulfuromonadaceae bacterium]|nr:replication initiation protein [Desulfuromonadaceae bacterium]
MAEVQKINPNRLVIKQGDKLSFAQYNLTLNEAKFVAFIMAQIDTNDTEFKEYGIKVKDFETLINARLDYTSLAKFAKGFQGKVLTLKNDDEKSFTTFNWWHHLAYKEGVFYAQLHDYMKPLLLTFSSHFGKSSLLYISQMKSLYAPRLYYMLRSSQAQYKNEFEITPEELYNILELKKSLRQYNQFNVKVLTPALEEINKITDLNVECKIAEKDKKKVTKLRFEFTKKAKDLLDFQS